MLLVAQVGSDLGQALAAKDQAALGLFHLQLGQVLLDGQAGIGLEQVHQVGLVDAKVFGHFLDALHGRHVFLQKLLGLVDQGQDVLAAASGHLAEKLEADRPVVFVHIGDDGLLFGFGNNPVAQGIGRPGWQAAPDGGFGNLIYQADQH